MKIKQISIFSVFLIVIIFLSCKSKKNLMIAGYGYSSDHIRVWSGNKLLFSKVLICGTKICSVNEKIVLPSEGTINLKIQLDSARIRLIDTAIFIPKVKKQPFISFMIPDDNQKRGVFLGDELDSLFLK